MGHRGAKDAWERLERKIDRLGTRAPATETLREILRTLYSAEEADLVARLPHGLSRMEEIARATALSETRLKKLLEGLCRKGLVIDLHLQDRLWYAPSPLVIGIFEFTMMRLGPQAKTRDLARLFHRYLEEDPAFMAANFGGGQKVSILRALPHEGTWRDEPHLEVLEYERAETLVGRSGSMAVGICSCRHTMEHLEGRSCPAPLETCTAFGYAANFLIRRGLAREVGPSEMREILARSRDMGLVLCADNVRRNVAYLCHCCGCCCTALRGISRLGYPNAVVSSSLIARLGEAECTACGRCLAACPIEALSAGADRRPRIDESFCLGCGTCALKCPTGALHLAPRPRRVLHPETVFEKVILQHLERGTLAHQLFADPSRFTHRLLAAVLGAFLRLGPVQRALMSEQLRSVFLQNLKRGARSQSRGWLVDL